MPTKTYTHAPTGMVLQSNEAFELDGIRYPSNWLHFASAEELDDRGIGFELFPDPPPPPITADQIKAEAQRRIHAHFPQWKQANMLARSAELFRIQAGFMRDADGSFVPARPLTAEEVVEEMAIAQAWSWIKAVRSASGSLEARSPVPQDYSSDAYWPG
jgi:hypothetical protein